MNNEKGQLEPIPVARVNTVLGRISGGRDSETYKVELKPEGSPAVTAYLKLTPTSHQLVAELAASQLGRALDLHIPRPYLAIVDIDMISERFQTAYHGSGMILGFASEQAGNSSYSMERIFKEPLLGGQHGHDFQNEFDIKSTATFDEWIANGDRHGGNIVYTPAPRKAWLIDHGRAFSGERWRMEGLGDPGIRVENRIIDDFLPKWTEAHRRALLTRAHAVCNQCAQLSLDELDRDGHYPKIDSGISAGEIATFLRQRTLRTIELLCHRLQIEYLPLHQPNNF